MKIKKISTKKDQIDHWCQQYLQAKIDGDKSKMKMYSDLIKKLGGKVPN